MCGRGTTPPPPPRARGAGPFPAIAIAAAIGLAVDPFTAQVAAAVCRPDHLLPVAAGDAAEFLSFRPLTFLPLGKELARRLHLMGVRTLGQFAQLPASAVREQFGSDIEPLHRLARGRGEQTLHPRPVERREEVRQAFDPPLANALHLADALARLAAELAQRLESANLEAGCLHLALGTEGGHHTRHSLALRQPASAAYRLAAALQELAVTLELPDSIIQVVVAAAGLRSATAYQLGLFTPPRVSPLDDALQRLAARHKGCAFYRAAAADPHHPLPERRFRLEPLAHDPSLA